MRQFIHKLGRAIGLTRLGKSEWQDHQGKRVLGRQLGLAFAFFLIATNLNAQSYLQESIFFQTDRDVYVAGEEIWGSIQCVDAVLYRFGRLLAIARH